MKKYILLFLICSFSFPLLAQKGGFIGIKVIPQSAWILNQDDFDSDEFDFAIPFSVAFALSGGYMFNDVVGIETQLLYSPQGQKYFVDDDNEYVTLHNDYFKIPLLFRFRSEGQKVAFLFNAGPEFGFLLNTNVTTDAAQLAPELAKINKDYYENFEFSVTMGFGTSISLGSNLQLDLLVQLDYGLTNIETDLGNQELYDYQGNGRAEANNAVAGFSVGLNYCFNGNTNSEKQNTPIE